MAAKDALSQRLLMFIQALEEPLSQIEAFSAALYLMSSGLHNMDSDIDAAFVVVTENLQREAEQAVKIWRKIAREAANT